MRVTESATLEEPLDVSVPRYDLESQEIEPEIVETWQLSRSVKYYSLLDGLFNLSFIFFSPYYVFLIFCSAWGYYASLHYKKCLLLIYLIYQICNTSTRLSVCIYDNIQNGEDYTTVYITFNIILTVLTTLLNCYIIRFTHLLIRKITPLTSENIRALKENQHSFKGKFLIW